MNSEEARDRIVRREGSLLIVDKPPGLPTSGRSLEDPDCLQYGLIQSFGQMVWAVHQLDADTSGINLFVLEKKAVGVWKNRMGAIDALKTYVAVVHGRVAWEERTVDAPIGMVDERSLGIHEGGKAARSHFRLLSSGQNSSLVAIRIETGRTHQIRIHGAHLGHPLLGEEWYVSPPCQRHPRQALHALAMTLGEWGALIPPPEDFRQLLTREGLVWAPKWNAGAPWWQSPSV